MHDYKINKSVQNIVVFNEKESSDVERFLVVFTTGESEIFEFCRIDDSLHWIESEKAREHDC